MNKSLLCFAIIFFSFFNSTAQIWDFAKTIGAEQSDKGITTKSDQFGNIVVSGYISSDNGIFDFGNGITTTNGNPHSKEMFVAKYSSFGNCIWAKTFGAYFDDRILGMDIDILGNIYITGTFWVNMDIEGIPLGSGGGDECMIAKLDGSNGSVIWANFTAGVYDNQGLDIVVDGLGNTYVAGFYYAGVGWAGDVELTLGSITIPPFATIESNLYKYWITKMNPAGNFVWAKNFGNLPFDAIANKYIERDIALCTDAQNNVYVAGGFSGTQDFGTFVLTSNGGYDLFALKMDGMGNFLWAKSAGSNKDDWANGIASDSLGHVYVVGEHRNAFVMDTVSIKNYDKRDVLILKLDDSNGTCIWGKRAGNNGGSERGNDVYANKDCKVYVVGDIGQKANFGSKIETPDIGGISSFVARISKNGDWLWAITGGSTDSSDRCNSVDLSPNGKLYVTGYYKLNPSYGTTNLTNLGKTDAFFATVTDNLVLNCKDQDDENPLGPISVPNVYTPNNDNINETFYIENLPENSNLIILNRWGNSVFSSTDYKNNWNGTDNNGELLVDGVYTYILTLPEQEKIHGFLHILR
jgi:gliding motility-associated-like protein